MKIEQAPADSVTATFWRRFDGDAYWIGITLADGRESTPVGPFDTQGAADRALKDLEDMAMAGGAVSIPLGRAN